MIVVPPDRQEEEREILARLQRGERVDHFETIRRRKDGALLNVSLTISPLRNQQGEIIGVSKIARDITAQKRTEEAIRTLNARLTEDLAAMTRLQQLSTRLIQVGGIPELLSEILDAGLEITAADMGNIQLLDDAGRLKIVAHRGFKAPFLEFFDEVHDGFAACGGALQKGERVIVEDVAGSPVFAGTPALDVMLAAEARAVQSTPLVSRTGKVLGMFSTHYRRPHRPSERELQLLDLLARQAADLIERKRGEEGRSQLSSIVEASADAIYVYDFDGTILTWNRAAEELYGFSADEIIGRSGRHNRAARWQGRAAGDHRRHRPCGRHCPGSGDGAPAARRQCFSDPADDIAYSRRNAARRSRCRSSPAISRNASERRTSCAARTRILSNSPIRRATICRNRCGRSRSTPSSSADRLGTAVEGETAEFLDFLRSAATRMELLVRDLLAYTQVTRLDVPVEETDANQTLAEALTNLGGAITESGATVTCDKLPVLRVHGTHVRQLFQNLVGNAIKYRSEDRTPTVHIGAERQDESWVFTVRDNGIGIQPEFKEQIFGLFARLHNADRYSGTGIGLAICQRIVERYHGRIWVESEPGYGSAFRFTLPV